jgi:hypothetical protein
MVYDKRCAKARLLRLYHHTTVLHRRKATSQQHGRGGPCAKNPGKSAQSHKQLNVAAWVMPWREYP